MGTNTSIQIVARCSRQFLAQLSSAPVGLYFEEDESDAWQGGQSDIVDPAEPAKCLDSAEWHKVVMDEFLPADQGD